jgi:endo-1,4-beta-xylanase
MITPKKLNLCILLLIASFKLIASAGIPTGKAVIGTNDFSIFKFSGKTRYQKSTHLKIVEVKGMPFTKALRISTTVRPEKAYDIQIKTLSHIKIRVGDILFLRFYARSISTTDESGDGFASVLFEKKGKPWTKALRRRVGLTKKWKCFYLPFKIKAHKRDKSVKTYLAGQSQFAFNLGYKPQTIEVAQISLIKCPDGTNIDRLPQTKVTYEGIKPDAPWRAKADARINILRKGDFKIEVVDANGKPVANARVQVDMTRHAFDFGVGANAHLMYRKNDVSKKYQQMLLLNFNQIVLVSAMKWPNWPACHPKVKYALDWADKNKLSVRGHALVWPAWKYSPWRKNKNKVAYLEKHPVELRVNINEHIVEESKAYAGRLVHWDVMNESYNNNDFMRLLGNREMIKWYKLTKKHDPHAKLFINDCGILASTSTDSPHIQYYKKTISYLLKNGAPLEGIGMQSHFGSTLPSPENLLNVLDQFAVFNLPIVITEFDHRISDKKIQALYMRDFLTTIFSHSAVHGFLMWGFWDGMHWGGDAPLYNKDWSLKLSGKAYRNLVFRKWWTREKGSTNAKGTFKGRGFKGSYKVIVTKDGRKIESSMIIPDGGVTIKLKI